VLGQVFWGRKPRFEKPPSEDYEDTEDGSVSEICCYNAFPSTGRLSPDPKMEKEFITRKLKRLKIQIACKLLVCRGRSKKEIDNSTEPLNIQTDARSAR